MLKFNCTKKSERSVFMFRKFFSNIKTLQFFRRVEHRIFLVSEKDLTYSTCRDIVKTFIELYKYREDYSDTVLQIQILANLDSQKQIQIKKVGAFTILRIFQNA